MSSDMTRRMFLGTVGATALAASTGQAVAADADTPKPGSLKILGIACSPRPGKTTAAAVKVALEAAKAVGPAIETELVELAGMNIPVFDPAAPGSADFEKVSAKLTDPKVAGILVGTPVYFGNMSSLCKAFLDRFIALRKDNFALANKVAGVVAVGGMRNGGQELTIQTVQAALMAQEMILVGDGRPTAHRGATLWNQNDDISKDELGLSTARNLGRRVAEVALALRRPA
jgi:multimeric flavodoxin WrbA